MPPRTWLIMDTTGRTLRLKHLQLILCALSSPMLTGFLVHFVTQPQTRALIAISIDPLTLSTRTQQNLNYSTVHLTHSAKVSWCCEEFNLRY
jgi:hypothetical protein